MPAFMLTECTCIALRAVSRKVTAVYDDALSPFGITIAQYGLLRRIGRAGTTSLTELGRSAELDRSTVGRNVRVLEAMGLVGSASGEDQREAKVSLSDEGRTVLDAAGGAWREAQEAIEARIGTETAATLRSLAATL